MYFRLPSSVEDKIVAGVEKRYGAEKNPDGSVNREQVFGRRLLLTARAHVRRAQKRYNRQVRRLIQARDPRMAKALRDPVVMGELALQEVVGKMTGWQRCQWARMGYPGLQEVPRRPQAAHAFLKRQHD